MTNQQLDKMPLFSLQESRGLMWFLSFTEIPWVLWHSCFMSYQAWVLLLEFQWLWVGMIILTPSSSPHISGIFKGLGWDHRTKVPKSWCSLAPVDGVLASKMVSPSLSVDSTKSKDTSWHGESPMKKLRCVCCQHPNLLIGFVHKPIIKLFLQSLKVEQAIMKRTWIPHRCAYTLHVSNWWRPFRGRWPIHK